MNYPSQPKIYHELPSFTKYLPRIANNYWVIIVNHHWLPTITEYLPQITIYYKIFSSNNQQLPSI